MEYNSDSVYLEAGRGRSIMTFVVTAVAAQDRILKYEYSCNVVQLILFKMTLSKSSDEYSKVKCSLLTNKEHDSLVVYGQSIIYDFYMQFGYGFCLQLVIAQGWLVVYGQLVAYGQLVEYGYLVVFGYVVVCILLAGRI